MARRVLVWAAVCLGLAAPVPAAADPALFAWMLFDQPDGWVRDNKPGLMVLSRDGTAQAGKVPGRAIIMVASPDATKGPFEAAFRTFVGASQALATEHPVRHGDGVTVNGHRILWEMRCCNSSKVPGLTEWDVGIGAPGRNVLLKLMLARMSREDEAAAVAAFQGMVRSLRPVATDRAFTFDPTPGPMQGLYSHLTSLLMVNGMGGLDMTLTQHTLMFDRTGMFSRNLPLGETLAAACARAPEDCGTYALLGDAGGPQRLRMTEAADGFGTLHTTEEPLERKGGSIELDGTLWFAAAPLPAALNGRWASSYATGGSMAFSSTFISSYNDLTLMPDGSYKRTGGSSVSGSNTGGSVSTSYAGNTTQRVRAGRYRVEGYTLVLTGDDGQAEVMTAFTPSPGSDDILVLNGSNWRKETK